MATNTTQHTEQVLLGVYLNDHLAGATAGLQLARRAAGSAEPGSESATVRKRLVSEIAQDRSALIKIMTTLGIKIRGYKMFAAWAGEKAGRLTFNGHLLTRSPLSDLEETEMLRLGVEGKAAGWRTLRAVAEHDSRTSRHRSAAGPPPRAGGQAVGRAGKPPGPHRGSGSRQRRQLTCSLYDARGVTLTPRWRA